MVFRRAGKRWAGIDDSQTASFRSSPRAWTWRVVTFVSILAFVGFSGFRADDVARCAVAARAAGGLSGTQTRVPLTATPTETLPQRQTAARWQLSFAWYQWFIESAGGGFSWFHTGERFEGPVHVNGDLKIDGDPWFGGPVTAGGGLTMTEGSNPTFVTGYWLNVEPIDLPIVAEVHSTLRAAAQGPGGLYVGPMGNDTYYEVGLGVPSPGYLTYTGYDEHGAVIVPATSVDISLLNGAAWFDETVRIWGVLDGTLTIGVDADIEIMDDIIYEGSTPGSGPNPDCDDALGLIAAGDPKGDIIIRNTVPNQNDCEIHAVMMALQKNIEAEDYQSGPPRGTITTHGGLLVDYSVLLGLYVDDVVIAGYIRDYHCDARMLETPPPFFPAREIETDVPEITAVSLAPCSPSPFHSSTAIRFSVPPGTPTTIRVYDIGGRLVTTVFEGIPADRSGEAGWDGSDCRGGRVASGIYFIRMEGGGEVRARKVVLLE